MKRHQSSKGPAYVVERHRPAGSKTPVRRADRKPEPKPNSTARRLEELDPAPPPIRIRLSFR